jgi:hypothetical protein
MTLSSRDRILLVVIVVIVAAFGFDKFALAPERRQAAKLGTQIAAQQASLSRAQESYASGRSAAAAERANAPVWAAAERAVPQNSDIPGLLRLLQSSAQAAHVDMQSISLSGTSATGSVVTAAAGSSAAGPTEIPVSLTFQGGYQALNRLVAKLDGLVVASGTKLRAHGPLVGISNVSLAAGNTGSTETVQLTATLYQHAPAPSADGSDPTTEGAS